ncbi:MAG: CooT family nickel-binding protein [Dehalococcoidales bacterium]|nr:CooT family nickel-binding protein [Dehalococcoidales bacterium]
MCLSNVPYIDSNGQQQEVMRGIAQMEAHDDEFLSIGLPGERKFAQGEVKSIDFVDRHSVVFEVDIAKYEQVNSASF